MKPTHAVTLAAAFALAACGGSAEPAESGNTTAADDFAARINNGAAPAAAPRPEGTVAPTIAQPLPNAAPGSFAPGTSTDPQTATCGANLIGPYLGKVADTQTRLAIESLASSASEVRFLRPGSINVQPDISNPRLNIMLDGQDIIRDARCG